MTFQKLVQVAMLAGAAFTATAQAQGYNNRDAERDMRKREKLERRVEADRRAVDKERREVRHAGYFSAGHERRELSAAERRLQRDEAELRELDARRGRGGGGYYR